jgi:hypothetical protein
MMKASTLCAISAGSAALCLASTFNVVCAAIYTAMVISSGWSLKNLSSCSDNACKALSASLTISFRRWRVASAPKQPILLPPCREVIVCLRTRHDSLPLYSPSAGAGTAPRAARFKGAARPGFEPCPAGGLFSSPPGGAGELRNGCQRGKL